MNVGTLNEFMQGEIEKMRECPHPIESVYCIRVSPDGLGHYRCQLCGGVIKRTLTPKYNW